MASTWRSHLTGRHRLEVSLLGLSVTTVWLIHVGEALVQSGQDGVVKFQMRFGASVNTFLLSVTDSG